MSSFGRVPKQQALFDKFTTDLQPGRLQWIGVRPARREPMITATEAQAVAGMGLTGDRRMQGSAGSGRQVTLIAAEHLDVIARLLHLDVIDPALVRRNLVVSGVNLNALRYQQFRVGDVVLSRPSCVIPAHAWMRSLVPAARPPCWGTEVCAPEFCRAVLSASAMLCRC